MAPSLLKEGRNPDYPWFDPALSVEIQSPLTKQNTAVSSVARKIGGAMGSDGTLQKADFTVTTRPVIPVGHRGAPAFG